MNQLTKNFTRKPVTFEIMCSNNPIEALQRQLRLLAAQYKMHYGIIHRLGPPKMPLVEATYLNTIRGFSNSKWQISDFIDQKTMSCLMKGLAPVVWQRGYETGPALSDPMSRLNISAGVSLPFHNAVGKHAALTLFDTAATFSMADIAGFESVARPLIEAVIFAHGSVVETTLSTREINCLEWAAAGKTSIETSIILGLSPHTVNQHLTRATEKLDAVNRTHAVTKAIRSGLINISAA